MVAHLPSLMKVSRAHVELIFLRAASLSGASVAFWKLAMQNGVRTLTTAAFASFRASCCAVPPVTQPPHEKPTIASATAPPAAPQSTHAIAELADFGGECTNSA